MSNSTLDDFESLHDAVVFNSIRNVPDKLKSTEKSTEKKQETNMVLDFFY